MGVLYDDPKGSLYRCEECKKPLIERLPNGLWKFKFGRGRKYVPVNGKKSVWNPVLMYIYGSIKIRCFRASCGHWNVFTYFPNNNQQERSDEKS